MNTLAEAAAPDKWGGAASAVEGGTLGFSHP